MMNEQLIHVDPDQIITEDNTRFNLKRSRLDSLKQSILDLGGIMTPVELETIAAPTNGERYAAISGFYRIAAARELNKEQGTGLKVPAIVRQVANPLERLKHQLSENVERENMSPMDMAVAIKRLMAEGVSRGEIRRIFARPGGKKGTQIQPASNSWVNVTLRFLELPKSIQERIHDGRVGWMAAYELGKVPPEKRQAVLERAESERLSQMEREEKDEERYLATEKKALESQEQEKAILSEVDQAKEDIAQAANLLAEREAVLKDIKKQPTPEDKEAAKTLTEMLKAAEVDVKGAQKALTSKKNDLAKLLTKAKSAAEVAAEQNQKLEAARKAVRSAPKKGAKTSATVGPEEIKKAAVAEGATPTDGAVSLSLHDIRQGFKDIINDKTPPKVLAIAEAFKSFLDGKTTPKELVHDLSVLTGEITPRKPLTGTTRTSAGASA